jgi:hypothetical protein
VDDVNGKQRSATNSTNFEFMKEFEIQFGREFGREIGKEIGKKFSKFVIVVIMMGVILFAMVHKSM